MEKIVERFVVIGPAPRTEMVEVIHKKERVLLVRAEVDYRRAIFRGDESQPLRVTDAGLARNAHGFEVSCMNRHAEQEGLRPEFPDNSQSQLEIGPFARALEPGEEDSVA